MRYFSNILSPVILLSVATTLSAGVIVSNGPATSSSFRIGGPNSQAEAVVWVQSALTGVSISALIGNVDIINTGSHAVDAYLELNTPGNLINSTTVTVGTFASPADFTPTVIFSGLSLASGAYRLTLFNTDTTGSVSIRWAVGGATTNTANGAFLGSQYSNGPDTNVTNPYLSNFTTSTELLGFTVDGTSPVPEPGTFLTSLVIFGAVGLLRRRA
ncbi:MAG: hypothetical protein NTV70_01580 [Acidobacteria bacterium]|nr:hypothetical protein [Acidobacteriota bacterium]